MAPASEPFEQACLGLTQVSIADPDLLKSEFLPPVFDITGKAIQVDGLCMCVFHPGLRVT
jgi:hypothetical protein